jgi:methionine-rich copper-binding protein CopC
MSIARASGGTAGRRRREAGRGHAAWAPLALACLALACAKREPPSGGPPDIEAPRVIAASPDSGAAGVALGGPFSITFSESMEPRSTGAAVSIAPYHEVRRVRWRGRTMTVTLAESLQAGRTYTLFVGATARDRHNNPLGTGETIVFSTGPAFPAGRIEGEIEARGFQGPGTHLWVYDAGRAGVPDSTARDYDAIGFAREGGAFRIDGLPAPGRYRLWGFADLNRNRSFEPDVDILAAADTVIDLTAEAPVASGVRIAMLNPRASGRVRGTVSDSLADSAAVLRVLARSATDSSLFSVTAIEADRTFDLQLAPGRWWLTAFHDIDNSRSFQGDREPASERLEVVVEPVADVRDVLLEIRRATRRDPEE